ncbi:mannosyltransferase family protein [Streptomyces sp. NBC_00654]|uniref:mannosyltransferase family protein n=1 Tax=Streptomyces sp. NBC_00654 TaxID=2975799 RepID=UPI002B1DD9D1|nr:mannosyltransferase family protein [Streptomyces sp. NBC_00654]
MILFAATKILGLVVLTIWSASRGKSAHTLLSERWDSLWYTRIAESGYAFSLQAPDGRNLSSMAFFPLLPWLEEGGSRITSWSTGDIGLVISAVSSLVAALGLFRLGEQVHSARAGVILACLWGTLPVAIVQSMAYSESLFVALAVWALLALLRDRWMTAGLLAVLAGLTRPVGVAISAAIVVSAVVVLVTEWSELSRNKRIRIIASSLVSPLGAVGFILWVGHQRQKLFGYLDVQAEWGNGFDGGIAFAKFLAAPVLDSGVFAAGILAVIVLLCVWPHWIAWKQRQPIALIVYSAIITVMAVGASGYFGSKPRLLIPAFPLLLALAIRMARARPALARAVPAAMAVVSSVYGAFWLNGSGPP